jgi:hypothetical protein
MRRRSQSLVAVLQFAVFKTYCGKGRDCIAYKIQLKREIKGFDPPKIIEYANIS